MKLRWLQKDDGKPPVLQQWGEVHAGNGAYVEHWSDVETVKEPRKAREWSLLIDNHGIFYDPRQELAPRDVQFIRVREVIENDF